MSELRQMEIFFIIQYRENFKTFMGKLYYCILVLNYETSNMVKFLCNIYNS